MLAKPRNWMDGAERTMASVHVVPCVSFRSGSLSRPAFHSTYCHVGQMVCSEAAHDDRYRSSTNPPARCSQSGRMATVLVSHGLDTHGSLYAPHCHCDI